MKAYFRSFHANCVCVSYVSSDTMYRMVISISSMIDILVKVPEEMAECVVVC